MSARLLLLAGLLPAMSWAFDLAELERQLATPAVVRGSFVQDKQLRALPLSLSSQGQFVLARGQGLLWLLRQPLQIDYRITAAGIARRGEQGWELQDAQAGASRQQRLFLAVLQGDSQALAEDFELDLQGSADDWQLRLTPRSALLGQIFQHIDIRGGALVGQIELYESQGDLTRLRLLEAIADSTLHDDEQHAFSQ